jgi:hypothetical protein
MKFSAVSIAAGQGSIGAAHTHPADNPAMVLLDVTLSNVGGLELLRSIGPIYGCVMCQWLPWPPRRRRRQSPKPTTAGPTPA